MYLMMSTSPKYDVVKASVENQPSENLTLDLVTQRLKVPKVTKGNKNSGLLRNSGLSDDVDFHVNKSNISCDRCKLKGHTARQCSVKVKYVSIVAVLDSTKGTVE